MKKLKPKNLSQSAADYIEEQIIKLELKQGERLLEAKLADTLGVSQSTIREAFRLLEKKGLVNINVRKGTIVTELSKEYVESLFDILVELYCLLIRKAMAKFHPEKAEHILTIFNYIKEAASKNDAKAYYDNIFNIALEALKIIKDSLLEDIIINLWANKRRLEYQTLLQRKKTLNLNVQYFQKLIDAMLQQDIKSAETIIREYMINEKEIALGFL